MFGRSTNNLLANLRWAKKGIFSFSYVPLEVISLGALTVSFLAVVAIILQIVGRFLRPDIPQGVATIIVVSLFLGAINLLSLSFIAEYIGKIFEEVKQRPQFVVSKLLNFDGHDQPGSVRERTPDTPSHAVRADAPPSAHRDDSSKNFP
jgi:dolichol-phosphate mannosyltransferase